MTQNYGINVSGGTINAQNVAAGKKARATSVTAEPPASLDAIRADMAALVEQIRANASSLKDSEQSATLASLAQQELAKDEPDKRTFLSLLQSLAVGVGTVGSLASAVSGMQHAVSALI